MSGIQISGWDLVIIGVYLLVMVLLGVTSIRRIRNAGDYYVAGRSFGPLVLMATVCATIIGG
ncbi:MAG: sodium:solute symporter family protein, partial [Oscillospiraceae bacterium]|nr:sodium:solute symporter family protein [Oscillospiraceae bacterium]